VFVVDTNILLYAANRDCVEHNRSLEFLERSRRQTGAWYVTWSILYGFMRVITHPRILAQPWRTNEAWHFVKALLDSPSLAVLSETDRHTHVVNQIIAEIPFVSGNLFSDFQIAVLMREHGVSTIYTRDVDFHHFPFLRVVDPLSG
jgi:uncharacterized protein